MANSKSINYVIVLGSTISGILALMVIGVPIIGPFFEEAYKIPPAIENWGGVIIGFYFGSFLTTIVDVLKSKPSKSETIEADK